MKTRDAQWFEEQHSELASRGQSWGNAQMYANKLNCLQWCCREQVIANTACMLDLGCGAGDLASLLAANGFSHVDGVDISPSAIQKAGSTNSGSFSVADFSEPCELKRKYDCIFDTDCFHMVIEMARRQVFLSNVKANLDAGGVFLTGINSRMPDIDPYVTLGEHVQYFWPSREEYINEVCAAGFRVAGQRELPSRNKTKCDGWVELIFKRID